MERADTILAYQDRIYRAARLVVGEPRRAARLVERAFDRLPAHSPDPERELAAALLPARALGWPWRPAGAELAAAGLAPSELRALRRHVGGAAPLARRDLAARVLLGVDITNGVASAPRADEPGAAWPRRAADLPALRALLARDLGGPPEDARYAELREHALLRDGALPAERAAALRADLLADGAAGERARALRDAVARADERLAVALPLLFGGDAPPELTVRLLRAAGPRPARAPRLAPALRLQLGLCLAVAALVAGALLLPRRAPEAARVAVTAGAPAVAPEELVARALDRFVAGAPTRGVLHERYAAEVGGERWVLERWYSYAAPHPLRVEVRDETDRVIYALATDGRELVQRREQQPWGPEDQMRGGDHAMSEEAIAAMLPILRQQPDGMQLFGGGEPYSLERYYLAQARRAELSDLGAASVAGRAARLVSFRSIAPTPPAPDRPLPAEGGDRPAQVVLAIDPESHAVLEVRVLPDADDAAGVVRTPWRAELHELLAALPAATYRLPPAGLETRDQLLVSPRVFGAPPNALISLPEAARRLGGTLYLPPPAIGPSLGHVLRLGDEDDGVLLLREGEHDALALIQSQVEPDLFGNYPGELRRAGEREYRLLSPEATSIPGPVSVATLVLSEQEGLGLQVIYAHSYASRDEREAALEAILRDLRAARPDDALGMAPEFSRR